MKKPKGKTAEERYQKVHSDLHIFNMARKLPKKEDLTDFYKKFNIKAKASIILKKFSWQ